jgi:hypothetical protein
LAKIAEISDHKNDPRYKLIPGEVYSMVGIVRMGLVAVAVAVGGGGTEKFGGRIGRLKPNGSCRGSVL